MGIAIQHLLSQEFFKDFHVIAGRKGLHRELQGIAIMDAPDSLQWSKGKELIITCGYAIAKEPDCIRKSFEKGSMQLAAGMMIKRERYLKKIPEEVIALFDQYEIPLISIPFESAYMDVMQQVNTIVMNRAIRRFQIQQNDSFQLSSTTYRVRKIKKILQAVEVEMNFPAFLYDVGEKEGYYSSANFKKISNSYGLAESDYWEPKQEYTQYTLCDYIHMSRIRLVEDKHPESPRVSWILIPIYAGGVLQAYFVVMESREFLDYYDEYSIRIAYLLLQAVYEQIVIANSVGNIGFENFVLYVMNSVGEDPERLLYQAAQQGLSMNTYYICILFHQKKGDTSARGERNKYFRIFQNCKISKDAKVAFLDENEGIILMQTQEKNGFEKEFLEKMITEFRMKVEESLEGVELEFAFLREGKLLPGLKQSIKKCQKVLEMGRQFYPGKRILDDEMLGPFTWIDIPKEELETLLAEYRELMQDEKNAELLHTLKIYLENNMNYSITAEKMYAHINTIRKRIDKVNSLLEIDWTNHMSKLKMEVLLQFLFASDF
ncbi:PucR family transcriptional regulator ligand-binding domain-containing protein [Lachnospiraceae bacterium OttesenSCG-928-J05]|nr:PucR family transcriptional regulator ligand-binding domain-containing protein [Lachnospiraceae bacterium OttesenSCG-928-J05]